MRNWLAKLFAPKYVGSVVRTAMAYLAGLLAGLGFLPPEEIARFTESSEAILTSLIVALATGVWSLGQKAKHSD